MNRIRVVYKKSEYNNKYIAYAPEFGDLYSGGSTVKEARYNLEKSLRDKGYVINGFGKTLTV